MQIKHVDAASVSYWGHMHALELKVYAARNSALSACNTGLKGESYVLHRPIEDSGPYRRPNSHI
jgi:hypothetical protein